MNINKFIFGSLSINYFLIKSNRKTLNLTVMPSLDIILKCPENATEDRINSFLKNKWFWLQKQINFFKKFTNRTITKEYVSGESFLYLGRQYKLIIKISEINNISLQKGKILLNADKKLSSEDVKNIINNWFISKAKDVFEERYNEVFKKFNYDFKPKIVIRNMQKRWGSFLKNDKIILNPLLIHAPKDCIDYVIAHELCHMKYKNHNVYFYNLLNSKYPNWEKTKEKLEIKLM